MHKIDENRTEKAYRPILRSWFYFLLGLISLYLSYRLLLGLEQLGIINSRENKGWVLVLLGIYLVIGLLMNIFITNKLIQENYIEYHQFTNTIGNVLLDKIMFLLFWVFKYPIFLLQVGTISRI